METVAEVPDRTKDHVVSCRQMCKLSTGSHKASKSYKLIIMQLEMNDTFLYTLFNSICICLEFVIYIYIYIYIYILTYLLTYSMEEGPS